MDTVDDNGVERKKHTHLIPRLKSKKMDIAVHILHMLQCHSYGGYSSYILAGGQSVLY